MDEIRLKLGGSLTMRWYSAYCFDVTVHHLVESLFLKDCLDVTSFLANSCSTLSNRVETRWTVRP